MIKKSSTQSEQDTALQLRYGKIGIGAVGCRAVSKWWEKTFAFACHTRTWLSA